MKNTKRPALLIIPMLVWLLSCVTLFPNTARGGISASSAATLVSPAGVSETPPSVNHKFSGQIVYTKGDYVYSINADGTNDTRLATGRSPVWSPDGTEIAFFADPDGNLEYDIFLMNSDGTNQRPLSLNHPEYSTANELDWQSNGNLIVFSANSGTELKEWDGEIFSIDVISAVPLQITHNHPDDWSPSWSPDGKQIVYVSPTFDKALGDYAGNIFLMNADGSDPKPLTNEGINDSPVFSPDGKLIAFTSARVDNNGNGLGRKIFIMNADGSNQRPLTDDPRALAPAWSPDGQWLVFSNSSEGNPSKLFIISVDGTNLTSLTDGAGADWKP